MKKVILILFVFISCKIFAQERSDTIFTTEGKVIIGRITEIQKNWIYYDYNSKNKIKNTYIHKDDIGSYTYNNVSIKLKEKKSDTESAKKVNSKDTLYTSEFVEPRPIIRLSVLAPGLAIEQKITPKITLVFNLWTAFAFQYVNVNGVGTSSFYIQPYFTLEPRFYFNLQKRKSMGKRTDCFSGNYIGLPLSVGFSDSRFFAGPVVGYQKSLRKRGYWNIGIGLGVNGYKGDTSVGFIGDLGLGFILNLKKKSANTDLQKVN